MLYKISKIAIPLLSLLTLFGCGDDKTTQVETVFVNTIDTVFVEKLDTVKVTHLDTVTVTPSGTIKKCKADFDSSFVPGKSVFFGNSLLLGLGTFGMCASQIDKDYYSRLKNYFASHDIPFEGTRIAGDFENMTTLEDQAEFLTERMYDFLDDSTGLVLIQLGDNIDESLEIAAMEETVTHLMGQVCERAPNARVLWIGEWYSNPLKQFLLKRIADDFGITFVDISDLNVPENQSSVGAIVTYTENYEFSIAYDSYEANDDTLTVHFLWEDSLITSQIEVESYTDSATDSTEEKKLTWIGHEYIVPNGFVASHPNDNAFAEIYKRILAALGYSNP